MKRNTFYLAVGLMGVVLVAVLWASIQLSRPVLIQVAFLAAVLAAYTLRRTVAETIHDERTNVITQHAAVATLSVFWVAFFVVSLGSVVWEFSRPLGILPPRPPGVVPPAGPHFGNLGLLQLGLLGLMILLYGSFRIYYARKFGDWESDEE
jgi:uncharacterized membrane protein